MLIDVQLEVPESLTTPKLTPEQLVESWRLSRKGEPGFREGRVATPSGEIKESEVCCWAQVLPLLQDLLSPGRRIKVCFPNLGDEAVSVEQREIRKFLQRCHGKDFSEYGDELARKIEACASFKKACSELPPGLRNARAWIEAHGINYAGPKTSLIVTDIRLGSDLAEKGASEAQKALSEHINSKRPLVTIVHSAEAPTVSQLMAEAMQEDKALLPTLDTAKVWIFGPDDPSNKKNELPREVSLREFIVDYRGPQHSNPAPENVGPALESENPVAGGEEPEKADDDHETPSQAFAEPSALDEAATTPEPEPTQEAPEADSTEDWMMLEVFSEDAEQPSPECDESFDSSEAAEQQHEATQPPAEPLSRVSSEPKYKMLPSGSTLEALSNELRAKGEPAVKAARVIQTAAENLAEIANPARKEKRYDKIDSTDPAGKEEEGTASPEQDQPTLGAVLETIIPAPETLGGPNKVSSEIQSAREILEACRARSIGQNIELLRDDLNTFIRLRSQAEGKEQDQRGSTTQDNDLVLLPNKGNVLFLSDIEGNVDLLAKIIDERGLLAQWRQGAGDYLCILGDCVDRSETGSLLIDFILELKMRAGGSDKVLLIPGNHELFAGNQKPGNYGWSELGEKGEKGLLTEVFTRKFGVESDAREHETALAELAQLAPLPDGFPAKDGNDDAAREVAARWGLYVLYNSIFHALPKSVLADKVLFAVHGCIPTDMQLPEGSSDEDKKKALALPSPEDIARMAWLDLDDAFDGMSEAEYRRNLEAWGNMDPSDQERLDERLDLVARSVDLYAASGGRLSLVTQSRDIYALEKGLRIFRQNRDASSLYVGSKALREFSKNYDVEIVVRGHQNRIARHGEHPLGTVLPEVTGLQPDVDLGRDPLPWVYENTYTAEGSKQGWVLRVDLDPSALNRLEVLKF